MREREGGVEKIIEISFGGSEFERKWKRGGGKAWTIRRRGRSSPLLSVDNDDL